MRTFIAVNLTDEFKKDVLDLYRGFRRSIKGAVKWVKPANLHFTLKFLGEVKQEELMTVSQAIAEAARQISSFQLGLAGPGVFPGPAKPKVLWLGVNEGQKELEGLNVLLEDGLSDAGFPPEKRPYHPHLTLARFKGSVAGLQVLLEDFTLERKVMMQVDRIHLMESRLSPAGPEYISLQKFPLE
ncbi:MAG: RNA 2',3'-cyclic phosphodiesterase [Halanaerobium sp.]|nr:RNA 2',3'-cyclic phosphodiesterase [Halanaerobium sp.]